MGTLQQEVQILAHAAAMPEQQRQREREQRQQAGPPPDLLRQLHAAAGGLAGAGARREQLAAGVFRPGHVQPTMSVEQFGELEYRRQALLPLCPWPRRRCRGWLWFGWHPAGSSGRRPPELPQPLLCLLPPTCRMVEQQRREAAAKERHERQQAARRAEDVEEEQVQQVGLGGARRLAARCPRSRCLLTLKSRSVRVWQRPAHCLPAASLLFSWPQQRAWDDFKDDNPRGWGNSKLRPCS